MRLAFGLLAAASEAQIKALPFFAAASCEKESKQASKQPLRASPPNNPILIPFI